MAERAIRWQGTDASWHAVVELHHDLEEVVFRNDDGTLDVETANGREPVPIGWWLVRRDDGAIEVRQVAPPV